MQAQLVTLAVGLCAGAIAPATAYYLRNKGALVAIGGGIVVGYVVNQYVLPRVEAALRAGTA